MEAVIFFFYISNADDVTHFLGGLELRKNVTECFKQNAGSARPLIADDPLHIEQAAGVSFNVLKAHVGFHVSLKI